jgi:hypothetical protein
MTAVALGSIPVGEKFCRLHSREDAPDRRAQISGSSDDLSCPEQKIHVDGVVQPSLAVVLRSEAQGQ